MSSSLPFDFASLRCEWLWVYNGAVPVMETWSGELLVPSGIFFVLNGRSQIRADGGLIEVPVGSAFFSAPGRRRQWFARDTRLLSVAVRVSWPDTRPLFATGLNCVIPTPSLGPLQSATRQLFTTVHGPREMLTHSEAVGSSSGTLAFRFQREAAFYQWFAIYVETLTGLGIEPATRQSSRDQRLEEIVRRLDAWPLEKVLLPAELVDGLPFGWRRLEQLLSSNLGVTPHAYLNGRRIETARQWLARSAIPIKQIAHDLGFRHASHFTKWFRLHTGNAPSTMRNGKADQPA